MSLLNLFHRHKWVYAKPMQYSGISGCRNSIRGCKKCPRVEQLEWFSGTYERWVEIEIKKEVWLD